MLHACVTRDRKSKGNTRYDSSVLWPLSLCPKIHDEQFLHTWKKKHENQAQTFFNVTESAKDQVHMSFMFFYDVPSISDGNVSKANI